MDKQNMEHIKVNFPRDKESFLSGNGEGMWVIVKKDVAEKYSLDVNGEVCFGTLDNNSV